MNPLVQMVRQLNYVLPWNQPKHSLTKRIDRLIVAEPGAQVYDRIQGDLRMRLDLSSFYERWIYLNTYDIVTVQLLRKLLRPGDVYVDAGANLGLLTLVASRAVGERGCVHAFEPMPVTLERLRENLALSGAKNVRVIPKGCWHEPGQATLHEFEDSHHGEPSMAKLEGKTVSGSVTIETVRIDAEVKPPVRLIKADIEGAEWGALRGASGLLESDQPPHLVLELNAKTSASFGYHPMEMVDWLMGFDCKYRLHLLKSKRRHRVTRDRLDGLFKEEPRKLRNVWFEPMG